MVLQSWIDLVQLVKTDTIHVVSGVAVVFLALQIALWLRSKGSSWTKVAPNAALKATGLSSSSLPIINTTLKFATNPSDFHDWLLMRCKDFQGRPFVMRTLGRPDVVILTTPESIEDVMKTHFESFPKGDYQYQLLGDTLGNGIFATDGMKWVHQRKVASHLFTARSLRESMTQVIRKHTVVLRGILHDAGTQNKSVNLFDLFNRFTIDAFTEIGFGVSTKSMDMEDQHPFQKAFDRVQRMMVLRFFRPVWFWKLQRVLQVGVEGQLREDILTINRMVLDIIAQSMQQRHVGSKASDTVNLVSLFLDNNHDKTTEDFDPQYLRDIVVNFLIAGRDSTAQALTWFFRNITMHPEVVVKIRAEIKGVLPGLMTGEMDTPTMDQVQQLTYLEAALKESLRLYPAVPVSSRVAAKDVVLSDGTLIRKGQSANIPEYARSRMEQFWGPDAASYNPDRWIDPVTGKLITFSSYQFFVFNAGPRTCLGMHLALLEMKIVVASLLSRLDVEVLDPEKVTYDLSLTLPVRGQMHAHVIPLRAHAL